MARPELWRVTESDLDGLDALGARELMIECFLQAQGGTFKRSAQALEMDGSETQLRETVRAAVRLKFKDLGCDFDDPTPADIDSVALTLAQEARSWGTPAEVVDHHVEQMHLIRARIAPV